MELLTSGSMRVSNPEAGAKLFSRYFACLKYFKKVLAGMGLKEFPSEKFFFNLKNLRVNLPKAIVRNAIFSLRNRVNYLVERGNFSFDQAVKVVNLDSLCRTILIPDFCLIFLENGISLKCPDDVIFFHLPEPLVDASLLCVKKKGFNDFEISVLRSSKCPVLNA